MTTIKFLQADEVLAAIIRALADKIAGHKIVSGQTDMMMHEKRVYEFDLDSNQHERFVNYVREYLPTKYQAMIEITETISPFLNEFLSD